MRVEILSLSLVPEGRVAQDSSVARLFVEYSLLDLHTEETPLSLPKPPRGTNINYNYSKGEAAHDRLLTLDTVTMCWDVGAERSSVDLAGRIICHLLSVVPVDAENNSTRRQLLRAVLQGKNPQMER